jgi:hypothetical protein
MHRWQRKKEGAYFAVHTLFPLYWTAPRLFILGPFELVVIGQPACVIDIFTIVMLCPTFPHRSLDCNL